MNTNNLQVNQTLKNYNELCTLLDIPIKAGNSKKSQLKQLECYCKYHKEGNKFIIDEIYQKPLPYIDERLKANEYVEEIGDIILEHLFKSKDNNELISLSKLMDILGIVNNTYNLGYNNKKELSSVLQLSLYDITYFYDNTRNEFKRIIERALNNLKSRRVLEWNTQILWVKKVYNEISQEYYYTFEVATDKQIEEILNIEKEVMQELGCRNVKDVFLKRLFKKLYTESAKRLEEKYKQNYKSYFKAYKLIIGDRAIKIEYNNIQQKKLALNSKIINKSNKLLKGYEHTELIDVLINLLKHDLNLDEQIKELKEKNFVNKFIEEMVLETRIDNIREQELNRIENKYSDDVDIYSYRDYIHNIKSSDKELEFIEKIEKGI